MTIPTSAISLQQLAALGDVDPTYFSKHRAELPPAHLLHTGAPGRPQKAFDADDLAALIVERTGHLSEAIVRLRLALAMSSAPHRIVTTPDNRHVMVRDHEELADLPDDVRSALLEQIHADRDTASQRRTRRHTEEPQP